MVFFKEKSFIIIISMYSLSFMLLVGQWAIADVFGITLTGFDGTPLKTNLLSLANPQRINTFEANVTNTNLLTTAVNIITVNGGYLFNVIQIITGTSIFNVLLYLYVPPLMVVSLTLLYIIFLAVTIISYIYRI